MSTTTKEALIRAHEGTTLARQRGRPTFKAVSTTRNEVSAHYAAPKTTDKRRVGWKSTLGK